MNEKLKTYRLTQDEYKRIVSQLGREPQHEVEWAVYSALWSEHCSYKSSKIHLKKFGKTLNERALKLEGENAGIVDIGEGERIAFKMESHNHPSFIDPINGAATGVGGILRDIFTMGARPIALADYLCFGKLNDHKMKSLVAGVVIGISHYGNAVGVPTTTGQTNFDAEYSSNILVNAMAIGYLGKNNKIAVSGSAKPGNLVYYVGAKTGRDGIHGASMASESFSDGTLSERSTESKKINIQIGDPFFEKLLIEACLEVIQKDLVVAIQDMGAAGLTSSSFEMSAKAGLGLKLDLDLVPVRESNMQPHEILLSESQERMLMMITKENEDQVKAIFSHWGLDAVQVGTVLETREMEICWKGQVLSKLDPQKIVDQAPVFERRILDEKPYRFETQFKNSGKIEALETEISETDFLYHKNSIYTQYDQRVGTRTVFDASHEVSILRLDESGRVLGQAVGCRPKLMKQDCELGALDAVFYPALQLSSKGIEPWAMTDCLNFGNPEKPEIMTEFVKSVEAIVRASIAIQAPVVSGNVSFYNETKINGAGSKLEAQGIPPTPAIGVVGLGPKAEFPFPESSLYREGLDIYVFEFQDSVLLGSERSKIWSDEQIEQLAEYLQSVRKLVLETKPVFTKAVGLYGLWGESLKLSSKASSFNSDKSNIGISFDEALISEAEVVSKKLYQVLFAYEKNQSVPTGLRKIGISSRKTVFRKKEQGEVIEGFKHNPEKLSTYQNTLRTQVFHES